MDPIGKAESVGKMESPRTLSKHDSRPDVTQAPPIACSATTLYINVDPSPEWVVAKHSATPPPPPRLKTPEPMDCSPYQPTTSKKKSKGSRRRRLRPCLTIQMSKAFS